MPEDILATVAAALADVEGLDVATGGAGQVVIQRGETRYVISVVDERSIAPARDQPLTAEELLQMSDSSTPPEPDPE